jgi:O-antigen/teichoic acid export membrane protein
MGVVIKQSFWSSFWAYIGVVLGYLSTLLILPTFMTLEEMGLFRLVFSNALLIAPFITLGMPGTYLKFFPEFRENVEQDKRIYSFQLFTILAAAALFGIFVFFFDDWIESYFAAEAPEYNQYIWVSFGIMVLHALFLHFHAFSRSHFDIILPNFLKEVYLRLGNIVLVGFYAVGLLTFNDMLYAILIVYGSSVGIQLWFLLKNHNFHLSLQLFKISNEWYKKLTNFSTYSLALTASTSIYSNISFAMIASTLGNSLNGIYTVCFYIGVVIEMPKRSMAQIMSPILSKAYKENNFEKIESLYKRSSLTLGSIALLFFLGICCNLNDLFNLIPKGESFRLGTYVVFSVAVAKVVDMIFSVNSDIIIYSKYYKYNLLFFIPCALLIIWFNDLFLPTLGITGAGISFLLATVLFNVVKFIFIWYKFKIVPFSKGHISLFLVSGVIYAIFWFTPLTGNPIFDVILRSAGITILFLTSIYIFKISPDINNLIRVVFSKYLNIQLPPYEKQS